MVKFKENDIYALKVENIDEQYNGRYIIIIKQSIPEWGDFINKKQFRFKITKDKKLPKLDEINSLEYIITHIQHELAKYFPGEGMPFEELKAKRDKYKVYPDEYGYLYTYISQIFFTNKNIPENLIYIGNQKIDLPKKEYIPFTAYGYSFQEKSWENIIQKLIDCYENINLKKAKAFSKEASQRIKEHWLDEIGSAIEVENLIEKLKEKGILDKLFEDEEEIEDSLTYVGGEDKDPYDIEE